MASDAPPPAISLKRNLAVTYGSQLYMALIGIVMLPFYLRLLGVEAYGLVGFFIALTAWLALFDFGLSATLSREAARSRAGVIDGMQLRALLAFVEKTFLAMGIIVAAAFVLGAPAIVSGWLHEKTVSEAEAITAVRLMGPVLALRFLVIPFRALLTGMEDLRWLGAANMAVSTLRSVLVLVGLIAFGASLKVFFLWQLGSGLIEFVVLGLRARSHLPRSASSRGAGGIVRAHWRFSLGMASAVAIWVAATNADKLILSGLVPLSDYALFSIATTAAGGVLLVVGPFAIAFGPRFTLLHAQGDREGLVRLYGQATQLTAIIAVSTSLTLALFPAETLWCWTGDKALAAEAAPVLTFYALGNGLLAIGGLPLQLQIAAGRLRFHVIGTAIFLLVLLPLLWWGVREMGMAGAGAAWLAVNLLFAMGWVAVVHRIFLPASHIRWLVREVLAILVPTAAVALLLYAAMPWSADRWLAVGQLFAIGGLLLLVAAASSSVLRGQAASLLHRMKPEPGR